MRSYPLRLLSECLNCCTDTNKFNRYFNEYYEELSPPLLRRIELRLRMHGFQGDVTEATKDLWLEIFFKHYESISEKRPEAIKQILDLTGSLKLSSRSPFINRQINTWKNEILKETNNLMSFFNYSNLRENNDCDLDQLAHQSNRTLQSYKAQGYELLTKLLLHDPENSEEVFVDEITFSKTDITNVDLTEEIDQQESQDNLHEALMDRIAKIKKIIEAEGDAAADAVVGCEGGARFSLTVAEILAQLYRILVPVMPTLYLLINRRVIDYMRKINLEPLYDQYEQTSNDAEEDDENRFEQVIARQTIYIDLDRKSQVNEEGQHLCMQVENLLQAPIDEAERMLKRPNLTDQQRKQLLKRSDRLKMCKLVYELKLMDHSQEEIASNLGLTRDQVRSRLNEIRQLLEPLKELLRRPEDQENI